MADRLKRGSWKIKPAWRIWARLHSFVVYVQEGELDADKPVDEQNVLTEASACGYNPIWVVFSKRNTRMFLELTGMTAEELEVFKSALMEAIHVAEPIVAAIDAAADQTMGEEEVSLRAFRPAPANRFLDISPTPRDLSTKEAKETAAAGSTFDYT